MSAMSGVVGFGGGGREKTYFELQREALIGEIAMVRSSRPPALRSCMTRARIWNAVYCS